MQLQCREVRVKNNEYEREQQRLVKLKKRVVVLRDNHTSRSVQFENTLTFSNST